MKDLPMDEIIQRYLNGESPDTLAAAYHVVQATIQNRLVKAGIKIRGKSQSAILRWDNASADERLRMAEIARLTQTGKKISDVAKIKSALAQERTKLTQSHYEIVLARLLLGLGIKSNEQVAVGPYNCDLSIGRVDIEVFGGGWHFYGRHLQRAEERLRYFLDHGWDVLTIVIKKEHKITQKTGEYVSAFVKECESRRREEPRIYRMIWASGEVLLAGTELDELLQINPVLGRGVKKTITLNIEELVIEKSQGFSLREIAQRHGVSRQTILRRLNGKRY